MKRFLADTRYIVVLPVVGLGIAASFFFIFGGIGLIKFLIELLVAIFGGVGGEGAEVDSALVIVEVVEFIHVFLVGTVLYITAVGLYQLFIHEVQFPDWLKIDSSEELEINLIGLTVVVLAVNFMNVAFIGGTENLLPYGAGIALPIAALALFIGLRTWSTKLDKEMAAQKPDESWNQAGED
jgi:uncharacterized membrane protein YqhA